MLFWGLKRGPTAKIGMVCFVVINYSVLFNLYILFIFKCDWIFYSTLLVACHLVRARGAYKKPTDACKTHTHTHTHTLRSTQWRGVRESGRDTHTHTAPTHARGKISDTTGGKSREYRALHSINSSIRDSMPCHQRLLHAITQFCLMHSN